MMIVCNRSFDEERAFYGTRGTILEDCAFDGPADGESALKEASDASLTRCRCNLRYPFWHDTGLTLRDCELTSLCRAAIWYTRDADISGCKLNGIKALRECEDVSISKSEISSPEFGWSTRYLRMTDTSAEGEYFMMRGEHLDFDGVRLHGKYSFQYTRDAVIRNCVFDTKDAFWHSQNVRVEDSVINGEYLAWYADHLTLVRCRISGTQPLCYCRHLTLIDCEMTGADFAFEKSDVEATLTSPVISIKNPRSGHITLPGVGELIRDDTESLCEVRLLP